MNLWLCSTPGANTPHLDQASAEAEAASIKAPAVAWLCCGVEETPRTPTACVVAPRSGERVVERVLGHLGMRLGASEEMA